MHYINQLIDDNDVLSQVIQAHFYLKRTEVMAQCEEWIAQVGQYCNDKRVGRSMLHHWKNLKVRSEGEKGKRKAWVHRDNYDGDDGKKSDVYSNYGDDNFHYGDEMAFDNVTRCVCFNMDDGDIVDSDGDDDDKDETKNTTFMRLQH